VFVSLIASYEHHGDLWEHSANRRHRRVSCQRAHVDAIALGTDTCAPGNVYSIDGVSNLPGVPHGTPEYRPELRETNGGAIWSDERQAQRLQYRSVL